MLYPFTPLQVACMCRPELGRAMAGLHTYKGYCKCGKITLTVSEVPLLQYYCHDADCAQYHSTHFIPMIGFPASSAGSCNAFKVVRGHTELKEFNSSGTTSRFACASCGAPIFNFSHKNNILTTFPILFQGFCFTPTLHVWCSQSTAMLGTLQDGLPKYLDVPVEYGGTGSLL